MALSQDAAEALTNLEEASQLFADRRISQLQRRASRLRKLNTRVDDFTTPVETGQVALIVTDIASLMREG